MFSKILVCLDGSRLAEQIIPYATEQALHFKCKVVLLQVYNISSSIAAAAAGGAAGTSMVGPDMIKEEISRLESEAITYLNEVAISLKEQGLDVSVAISQGTAGDTIVSFAQAEGVDLIALATHGHSGLGRVVFGSVADKVLRDSGLPILIIKPQDTEKK
jgi:nucleotide-binding universal stress UspA family protein